MAAPPVLPMFRWRLQGELLALVIYGSWAARYEGEPGPTPNAVDVLVVGRVHRDEVYDAAQRAQGRLGREVNTTIRTRHQWETATVGFTQQLRTSTIVELPYPLEVSKRHNSASSDRRFVAPLSGC